MKLAIKVFVIMLSLLVFIACEDQNRETFAVYDKDGNGYDTIVIGTQIWIKQNLKTTKNNDGSQISLIADSLTWQNLNYPAYCYYKNNQNFKDNYGALYNWYAVSSGKVCPSGWHIPTIDEWSILIEFLGGENIAGGKMKQAGTILWESPNTGATNQSRFTSLPGGMRTSYGQYFSIGEKGYWWSATTNSEFPSLQYGLILSNTNQVASFSSYRQEFGFSIRCIKD